MKPAPFLALAVAIGLGCAALLLWLSTQRPTPVSTALSAPPGVAFKTVPHAQPPTPRSSDTTPPLSPELRAWLLGLQQALARRDTRANEALLSFKDEAALQ